MRKALFLLGILGLPFFVAAQRDVVTDQMLLSRGLGIANDIVGRFDVEGSEFLNDNWTNAIIQTNKDEIYKNVKVKYSVFNNQLYFLSEKDATMKFVVPIKEFSLLPDNGEPKVFKSGFPKVSGYDETAFYQVLTAGKAVLLKKTSKRIIEKREYNSAVTTKEYVSNTKYFLFQDGKIIEAKKDKSFMLSYLGKKAPLEEYIKSKKLDFKKEESLVQLVSYSNTL